jgi:diadenosine tetraphosphatase ApaH/serine/threonine PP2A family protein phosphatase
LRQYDHVCVAGNHDWGAIGKAATSDFNPDAAVACRWTARQLSTGDIGYLEGLPLVIEKGDFTLVHGSPRQPVWEYLISAGSARENLTYFRSQFCLVGHSHVPVVFKYDDETDTCLANPFTPSIGRALGKSRLIINPGGVGQPRDGDPRASYAIYDSEASVVRLYRVPYDIEATQTRMVRHNLPMRLVARLSQGV